MRPTDGPALRWDIPISRWSDDSPAHDGSTARQTRRRLLLAAADRIHTCGYAGATLREIVDLAEVTKGALYFHFDSKLALATALVDEVQWSWRDTGRRAEAAERDPLHGLLMDADMVRVPRARDPLVRGVVRVLADNADFAPRASSWVQRWSDRNRRRLEAAAHAGLLRPTASPERVAHAAVAMMAGHFRLAEVVHQESVRSRMDDSWTALLEALTVETWRHTWETSGWRERRDPEERQYRAALAP